MIMQVFLIILLLLNGIISTIRTHDESLLSMHSEVSSSLPAHQNIQCNTTVRTATYVLSTIGLFVPWEACCRTVLVSHRLKIRAPAHRAWGRTALCSWKEKLPSMLGGFGSGRHSGTLWLTRVILQWHDVSLLTKHIWPMSNRGIQRQAVSVPLLPHPPTLSIENWEAKAPIGDVEMRIIALLRTASEKILLPFKVWVTQSSRQTLTIFHP